MPNEKRLRYSKNFGLDSALIETVIATRPKAEWFEKSIEGVTDNAIIAIVAKWYVGEVMAAMKANKVKLSQLKFGPKDLFDLVVLLHSGKISSPIAKQVLVEMFETGVKAEEIVRVKGLEVVSDENAILEIAKKIVSANPKVIEDMKKNPNAYKFLIGQVMKELQGKANPQVVERTILTVLKD